MNGTVIDLNTALSQQKQRASSAPPDEQFNNIRQQLMNAQIHITNLELEKSRFQQIINDKELEIKRLEKEYSDSIAEKEDVHVALRTQLDLYKADYEAEVVARNSLMAEKNQIVEDLQNLQRRNQQLIDEVEKLRRDGGGFVHVERPRRDTESSSSTTYVSDECCIS